MFEKTSTGEWALISLSLLFAFVRVFSVPNYESGASFLGALIGSFLASLIVLYITYRIILKLYPQSENWSFILWIFPMIGVLFILFVLLLFLIIALAFIFGTMGLVASSSSPPVDHVPITPTTTTPIPKFVAGDIAAKSSTQADPLWLILSYDKNTDEYKRALIYKNADGKWGHRSDNKSEKMSRADMEKIYPVKITRVPVSLMTVMTPSTDSPI